MHRTIRVLAIMVVVGLLAAINPQFTLASTILTYTGNVYNAESDNALVPGSYFDLVGTGRGRVSGLIELLNPLGPNFNHVLGPDVIVGFVFQDGRQVMGSLNPDNSFFFYFKTDGTGELTDWVVRLDSSVGSIGVDSVGSTNLDAASFFPSGDPTIADSASTTNNQGTWTQTVSTPEPASISLLVIGLAGLAFRLRKENGIAPTNAG